MGEQFIRHVVCHDICARMQYKYGFSATGKAQAQGFPAGAAANSAADPITQAQADGEEGSSLLIENGSTNSASGGGGGRGQDAGDGSALRQAVQDVVHGTLSPGDGGVIAVDVQYNIVMDFNTPGMYRGACDHTGRWEVAVFDTKA